MLSGFDGLLVGATLRSTKDDGNKEGDCLCLLVVSSYLSCFDFFCFLRNSMAWTDGFTS